MLDTVISCCIKGAGLLLPAYAMWVESVILTAGLILVAISVLLGRLVLSPFLIIEFPTGLCHCNCCNLFLRDNFDYYVGASWNQSYRLAFYSRDAIPKMLVYSELRLWSAWILISFSIEQYNYPNNQNYGLQVHLIHPNLGLIKTSLIFPPKTMNLILHYLFLGWRVISLLNLVLFHIPPILLFHYFFLQTVFLAVCLGLRATPSDTLLQRFFSWERWVELTSPQKPSGL